LEGRLLAEQRHELLGHALARQWPETLAGAADQDHGSDERHVQKTFSAARSNRRIRGDIAEGLRQVDLGHVGSAPANMPWFSARRRRASRSTVSTSDGMLAAI